MKVFTAVLSLMTLAMITQFPVHANSKPVQQGKGSGAPVSQAPLFSQAELDQMLAPIALYPDTVLSHVLIAATYPLEIVKATRWLSTQPGMTSEQSLRAAENEPWDPSVRALVAFPPLLTKMNNELEWTQRLGDAFLSQETDVMATVQQLRERAYKAGNLGNQEHITVERKEKIIVIEPRQREVVYVPVYDTRVVYGDWWWDRYPPIHWPYPSQRSSYVYWGVGARVSPGFYFSTFYWPERQVVVLRDYRPNRYYRARDIYRHEERRHWSHNPYHRHGVVYPRSYRPVVESRGPANRYDRPYNDEQERRRWSAERRIANDVAVPQDRQIIREPRADAIAERPGRPGIESRGPGMQDRDMERLRDADDRRQDLPTYSRPVETTPRNKMPGGDDLVTEQPIDFSDRQVERPEGREIRGEQLDTNPDFAKQRPDERRSRPNTPTVISQPEPGLEVPRNEPVLGGADVPTMRGEPVYNRKDIEVRQDEPVFSQPEPRMQRDEPVFSRPEPVMQRDEPVFSRPEPVMQRDEPVFSRPETVNNTVKKVWRHVEK